MTCHDCKIFGLKHKLHPMLKWELWNRLQASINGHLLYAVVQVRAKSSVDTATKGVKKPIFERSQHIVVVENLVSTLQLNWGVELDVLGTFCGSNLENYSNNYPLENRE